MRKIFIAPVIERNKHKEEVIYISTNWIAFFKSIGFETNTSFSFNSKTINGISKKSDALLLCGTGDISKLSKTKVNRKRDQFEKKLLISFLKKNKPVLAVCRGFQLIASLNSGVFSTSRNHVRKVHYLKINKESQYIKFKQLVTNSFHKNVVKKISKEFKVVARSDDGFIEITENFKKKILCFMFHPERYNNSDSKIKTIIKNFLHGSINTGRRKRK